MLQFTASIPEVTVFLSSPGDVAAERQLVKGVIQEINADPAWRTRCLLKTLAYEDCVPSQMGKSAQRVVDDFMRKSSQANLVICIFCNRMGTPTIDEQTQRTYESGTHYEFDSAYQAFQASNQRAPRVLLYLGIRPPAAEQSDEEYDQHRRAREFKKQIKSCADYAGLYFEYRELEQFANLVSSQLKQHLHDLLATVPAEQEMASAVPDIRLRDYLEQLAESYRWLELQGIRDAGTLRIELEKVYVALKAEPESDYDRQQAASLHAIEMIEAARVASLDVIDPLELAELEAANIRRTYRPGREAARRAGVTEGRTLGDAFRLHRRLVILGGPGSGKSTLARWLALQFARGLIKQMDTGSPARVVVPVGLIDPDAADPATVADHPTPQAQSGAGGAERETADPAVVADDPTPQEELAALAQSIKKYLKGREEPSINVGPFTCTRDPQVSRGPGLCQMLEQELTGLGVNVECQAALAAEGAYAEKIDKKSNRVYLEFTCQIVDRKGTEGTLVTFRPRRIFGLPALIESLAPPTFLLDPAQSVEERELSPIEQADSDDLRAVLAGSQVFAGVDLGPARVPIFLRIAHFARELAECDRQRRTAPNLEDYLGRDPDNCSLQDGCTAEARNALFRASLEAQQAVVILDGLDELSEANRRSVVLKIEDFIAKYTAKQVVKDRIAAPWQAGGNQVVVTSRYVGYKLAPLRAGSAHFGIQAMQRPAVVRFAHSWTGAVNAELAAEGKAGISAEALIAEIYNDARPAVRELATNPLLVTILSTVYWANGHLPDQRAGVYDRVVENLLRIWLQREECRAHGLTREELLAALEPLAAEMHENAGSNGLIGLDRIGELVEAPLAHLRGMSAGDRRFRPVREALLATIRRHVGLLAEQSPGNYAFFHRTFQEFLAARHLLTERETAAAKIIDRLDDPLWREPLLLALGFAMIDPDWGPAARVRLLGEVLAADGPAATIPRAALLVTAALPDLRDVPTAVVAQVSDRLLAAYAATREQNLAATLREQIEQAFGRLKASRHADTVANHLAEAIRRRGVSALLNLAAAAEVLRRFDWFTTELVEALLLAIPRDRADRGWPVNRALLAALARRPSDVPWLAPAPALNMARLGVHLPMRRYLEANRELVEWVRSDTDWLWLLVALYGGLGNVQFLERLDRLQRQRVEEVQGRSAASPMSAEEAEAADSFLRVSAGKKEPQRPLLTFDSEDIVRDLADAELSRHLRQCLAERRPAAELTTFLEGRWAGATDVLARAEALVGLAALGEDVVPRLREALTRRSHQAAAQAAIERFGWLQEFVREPLVRTYEASLRAVPGLAPECHRLDLLRIALDILIAAGSMTFKVSNTIPEYINVAVDSSEGKASLDAEWLPFLVCGNASDDAKYNLAVVLDTVGRQITASVDHLIRTFSLAYRAVNHRAKHRVPWPQPLLPPRAVTMQDHYLALLDTMAGFPRAFDFFGAYVLGMCRPFVETEPELFWETVAVARTLGPDFLEKFRTEWERDLGEPFWDSGEAFLKRAATIANPYLRFRAQWRFGASLAGGDPHLTKATVSLIDGIADPHCQVRALEWVLISAPTNFPQLLGTVAARASRIADPENRARAYGRLMVFGFENLDALLTAAIVAVAEIADTVRRAETIQELKEVWGSVPEVRDAFDTVAQTISDPWQRHKALGHLSRLVQTYRPEYPNGSLPWGLVYLSAAAAEVELLGSATTSVGKEWPRLLGPERSAAVSVLEAVALEEGLRVTMREVSILDRIVQAGQSADLERLWPLLERPDAAALATIARWGARSDQASSQWAALVQAEEGRLTPETVGPVLDLLATSTDQLRIRAACALHGWYVSCGNKTPRWSIRRVGPEALELVARRAVEGCAPMMNTSLGWVHHDIHQDDRESLERWLAWGGGRDGHAAPALWILAWMESIDNNLLPPLLAALKSGPPPLQRALLRSLARLCHCWKSFSTQWIHAIQNVDVHSLKMA